LFSFSHTGNSSLTNLTQLQLQEKQLGIFPSFDKKAALRSWGYISIISDIEQFFRQIYICSMTFTILWYSTPSIRLSVVLMTLLQ
jgi:hypothetical protein